MVLYNVLLGSKLGGCKFGDTLLDFQTAKFNSTPINVSSHNVVDLMATMRSSHNSLVDDLHWGAYKDTLSLPPTLSHAYQGVPCTPVATLRQAQMY